MSTTNAPMLCSLLSVACPSPNPDQRPAESIDVEQTDTATTQVDRVRGVIARVLGVRAANIRAGVSLSETGELGRPLDDLDVVEIVLALEDEFHVKIADEAVIGLGGGSETDFATRLTLASFVELVANARPQAADR